MSTGTAHLADAGPITTIGFDGDDTLWDSESHFVLTTKRFADLLEPWLPSLDAVEEQLLEVEGRNLGLLGYGVKAFTLSMIETAIEVSDGAVPASHISEIISWAKELLDHPVDLLDGVVETVDRLATSHRLILVTKGDLFHQESKVARSGLAESFDGIEIVSEKDPETYRRVLDRHGVSPGEFLMVGNSVRSDVLPVLEIGGRAVHIPYHVTWALETVEPERHQGFDTLPSISDLVDYLTPSPT
jgi:putative hydrolase of the HAD superfamily